MTTTATTSSTHAGVGFPGLLTVAFIVLKLTHVIAWSWWWVLAPLWLGTAIGLVVVLLLLGIAALVASR